MSILECILTKKTTYVQNAHIPTRSRSTHSFLAFDLGAGSGRSILGTLQDGRLALKELNRFPNEMIPSGTSLHWDVRALYQGIKEGIAACSSSLAGPPESLAVNTWGVDYAFLDSAGKLIEPLHTYRDQRTDDVMEQFFEIVPRERVYELTGNQFMQFNTLFQLFAALRDEKKTGLIDRARSLLFMPDIFHYFFTGAAKTEFTFATTSQLFNPLKKAWEEELFLALGAPLSWMQEVIEPGSVIGPVQRSVRDETGIDAIPVVAAATHDTGSAVAAVPASGDDWAYISSGTWSLMGIERREPILSAAARDMNFTNEGGVGGTFRFLKNLSGLWLLEQCRKVWTGEHGTGYDLLFGEAAAAPPFRSFVDGDDPAFLNPPDMTVAIGDYCTRTGQPRPATPGAFTRCVLESLALKYRYTLEQLRRIDAQPINRIHIIGGGAQNDLLCRYTANATGLPVLAGPVEATSIGNIMVQALALGHVKSHAAMRDLIGRSFDPRIYEPAAVAEWDDAFEGYRGIVEAASRDA
jgi:rhamnulokinase